jgi:hypothetical protein
LIWFQGVNITTLYAKVARFLQQACEPKVPRVYVELFHWKGWTRHRTFSNPTRNIQKTTLSEHLSDIGMSFSNPTQIQGTFYQQEKPELPVNLLQHVPYFWLWSK